MKSLLYIYGIIYIDINLLKIIVMLLSKTAFKILQLY